MLTVRWVSSLGHERVFLASEVTSKPGDQVVGGERIIRCEAGTGVAEIFTDGSVYVMNEEGKTVVIYKMDKVPANAIATNG